VSDGVPIGCAVAGRTTSTKPAASSERTLLLNSTYEPIQVISWKRAVTMIFLGKVEVVRSYERTLRAVSMQMATPAVVKLHGFVRRRAVRLGFSRRSLFSRDGYRCQYCGEECLPGEITCDHVVPRSQGGTTDWDNVVTCCATCNRRKGGRTPEQASMRLVRLPRKPEDLPMMFRMKLGRPVTPDAWREFLEWQARPQKRRAAV
jgi:5-methylcytosine-specific restriction endonuclease McrA